MKKVNFRVSISLFVGFVFSNPAFSSIVLSSGHVDINRGGTLAINTGTSLIDMSQPVMDTSITLSGSIVRLSGVSQIESELSASAVPLPAAFWFFGSALFGLASLRLSGISFTKYITNTNSKIKFS